MTAEWLARSLLPQPGTDHVAARELAQRHAPDVSVDEDGGEFREAWKRFADFGLYRLAIPEAGLDVDAVLGTLEGLGEGTRNAGFLLGMGAHSFAAGAAISRFGSEGQRRTLDLMRDGSVIAAFAASEPEAGSDVMSLRTRCAAAGNDYLLDGTKHFVTNAGLADCFVIFASRELRLNWRGVTAFLVPRDTPGLSLGPEQRLIGLTGCSIRTVHLDSATVPRSAMLGRPGQGSSVFRHAMLWERSLLAALTVGTIRRQLTEVIDAALARDEPAETNARHLDTVGPVVDIMSRYLLGRLLVRDTVTKLAASTLTPGQASLTKLWISEAELATSRDLAAIDMTTGLLAGSPRTGDVFNAIGATIYSGTSDIQRRIIAAELGILE
jgi:alkylation response protein AidB-like acyl-CoA dehydrogenase